MSLVLGLKTNNNGIWIAEESTLSSGGARLDCEIKKVHSIKSGNNSLVIGLVGWFKLTQIAEEVLFSKFELSENTSPQQTVNLFIETFLEELVERQEKLSLPLIGSENKNEIEFEAIAVTGGQLFEIDSTGTAYPKLKYASIGINSVASEVAMRISSLYSNDPSEILKLSIETVSSIYPSECGGPITIKGPL